MRWTKSALARPPRGIDHGCQWHSVFSCSIADGSIHLKIPSYHNIYSSRSSQFQTSSKVRYSKVTYKINYIISQHIGEEKRIRRQAGNLVNVISIPTWSPKHRNLSNLCVPLLLFWSIGQLPEMSAVSTILCKDGNSRFSYAFKCLKCPGNVWGASCSGEAFG